MYIMIATVREKSRLSVRSDARPRFGSRMTNISRDDNHLFDPPETIKSDISITLSTAIVISLIFEHSLFVSRLSYLIGSRHPVTY